MRAKAIYACIAENAGEITFDASDTLTDISDSAEDGWLTGTVSRTGDRGLFPVVYTELQPETGDDLRFLQTLQSKGLLSSTIRLEHGKPVVPPKPTAVVVGAGDAEERMQREREAALDWEARHGIKKVAPKVSAGQTVQITSRKDLPGTRPPISTKPVFQATKPPVATGKPPVPVRTPSIASTGNNPALENDAPRLPSNPSRQAGLAQASQVQPVVENIQPLPRSLISKLNGLGFEDSFEPSRAIRNNSSSMSSLQSSAVSPPPALSSVQSVAAIPLTSARHMQGNGSIKTRPAAAAPPAKKQLSYVSRQPVLTQNHPGYQLPANSSSGNPIDAIPQDALQRYSHLFKRLDKESGRKGYLTTDQVHAVVVRCRLPDDQMRRIWALADRNLNGKFGPGEFNLIMHLADAALRRDPIPDTLSVDLLRSAY
ncbi:Intersectin 1 (SH3 domain protein) [Coemansia asiatica]|uniref:Intersectin 1 (SH3 domain protein) n=1 Tax=Coemansia asiatica TaxID=1052880 RepID=A0A9W8CI21_9FUNG|nr:Intersectin 1 (SH3 domain protein) [Coemansia asiatica]